METICPNAFNGCVGLTEAVFKDMSNWYVGNSEGAKDTAVSKEEFENQVIIVKYLNITYANKYWSK